MLDEPNSEVLVAKAGQFLFYIKRVPDNDTLDDNAPYQTILRNTKAPVRGTEVENLNDFKPGGTRYSHTIAAVNGIMAQLFSLDLFFSAFFNSAVQDWFYILAREERQKLRILLGIDIGIGITLAGDARLRFESNFERTGKYQYYPPVDGRAERAYYYVPSGQNFLSESEMTSMR